MSTTTTDTDTTPKLLSLEEIFAADDVQEETVPVPEWGGAVKVRGLSMAQVNGLNKQAKMVDRRTGRPTGENDPDKLEQLLFLTGVIEPRFDEAAYKKVLHKSAGPVVRILTAINRLSGLTEDAVAAATKSAGDES